MEREEFDRDGILVGWMCDAFVGGNGKSRVFIPRRDEDIARDRAEIAALMQRARRAR